MNIMELGAIGELAGGVAVIASLIYVGLQGRQGNRFDMFMIQLFRSGESQFYENRDGLSSDDMWESYERTFAIVMRQPGAASSWDSPRDQLSSRFASWVDGAFLASEA